MDPTYELISKQILTSNQTDVIFSNIPQGYKDLVINISARSPVGLENILMQFNGSSSGYSSRHLRGSGSAAASFDQTAFGWGSTSLFTTYTDATSNTFSNAEIYIPNYSGVTNKSISATGVQETNSTTAYILATAGAWSNTSPITSIRFYGNGSSLAASSSFYLYGIKNADDGGRGFFGPAMTGGDEVYTTGDGYKVHVFKNSGTLNVTAPGEVECLVVAGGGGSGGGGGGAGGFISRNQRIDQGLYNILIGAGGVGGTYSAPLNKVTSGTQGGNTSALGITSTGGGFGGGNVAPAVGGSGGSGGGVGYDTTSGAGLGISSQGNNGGVSNRVSFGASGGGGGAGAAGSNATSETTEIGRGGDGGIGLVWPSGSNTYYAGGGGGGANSNSSNATGGGTGGLGGGGNGARNVNGTGSPGTANTGGGGGGGETEGNGANGGSGIVIIRYRI